MNRTETAFCASPFGVLELVFWEEKLTAIHIREGKEAHSLEEVPAYQRRVIRQLQEYFEGKREVFDVPIHFMKGTDFEQAVWKKLLNIPYGRSCAYSDIALQLDKGVRFSRAVGRAVGQNPIAIIVPCHRVMGKNGSLTGFAWGLERKAFLIDLERRYSIGVQGTLF